MHIIYMCVFISVSIFASSNNFDLVMTDITRYDKTATSLSLQNTKISYDIPAISYMAVRPKYLILAALKVMPKQSIGTTFLGNTPIKLKQELWKYELGAAYKFYLTEKLFIAPALLYSDYYSTLYKIAGTTMIKSKSHDSDVRFYGLAGYKLAKSTMMLTSVELDNDILSDNYSNDYSQYPISIIIYQFLSKEWFVYAKYQQALKDKKATNDSTGNMQSISYGFGFGMKF